MKKAILDTSFILSAVRHKIDFLHEIDMLGLQTIIPARVMMEIDGLSKKPEAKLAKIILEKNRKKFWIEDLKGKTVDNSIIRYSKEHPKDIIATLDREIKKKSPGKKLVIRGKKKLEIV